MLLNDICLILHWNGPLSGGEKEEHSLNFNLQLVLSRTTSQVLLQPLKCQVAGINVKYARSSSIYTNYKYFLLSNLWHGLLHGLPTYRYILLYMQFLLTCLKIDNADNLRFYQAGAFRNTWAKITPPPLPLFQLSTGRCMKSMHRFIPYLQFVPRSPVFPGPISLS